jgi:hypothetical protein
MVSVRGGTDGPRHSDTSHFVEGQSTRRNKPRSTPQLPGNTELVNVYGLTVGCCECWRK